MSCGQKCRPFGGMARLMQKNKSFLLGATCIWVRCQRLPNYSKLISLVYLVIIFIGFIAIHVCYKLSKTFLNVVVVVVVVNIFVVQNISNLTQLKIVAVLHHFVFSAHVQFKFKKYYITYISDPVVALLLLLTVNTSSFQIISRNEHSY